MTQAASVLSNSRSPHPRGAGSLAYRPDIDGLRAIAVLAVVAFHVQPRWMPGGFVGVDVFFVVSGYLISGIIFSGLRDGSFSFGGFYGRRIRRIFPALLVVLAVTYGLGRMVLLSDEYRQLGAEISASALFVSNFAFWKQSGYFDTVAAAKPLLHLWSLGIEEQFYLLWPAVLVVTWKKWPKGILPVCGAIILATFTFNVWEIYRDPAASFYLPFSRFWELLFGAALASSHVSRKVVSASETGAAWRMPVDLQAVLGLLLVLGSAAGLSRDLRFPGWWAFLPASGAVLLISAGPHAWINRRLLSSRALVFIGLISYPLYLWHWPLLSLAHISESGQVSLGLKSAVVLLAVLLSWITYFVVEKPIRFGRPRLSVMTVLCALLAALGFAGLRAAYRPDFDTTMPVAQSAIDQMKWSQARSPGCGNYPFRFSDCLITKAQPVVSLLGDSHAMTLAMGLNRLFGEKLPLIYIGSGGCPPLMETESFYKNEPDKCIPFVFQPDNIRKVVTGTKLVILTSRGPMYIEAPDWHLKSRNGETGKTAFLKGYSETISFLEKLGKSVLLVVDGPEPGYSPAECFDTRPFQVEKIVPRSPCAIKHEEYAAVAHDYRAIVAQLKRDHPALVVFDSAPLFCDEVWCHFVLGGQVMYRDADHLSMRGAMYVGKSLMDALSPDSRALLGVPSL